MAPAEVAPGRGLNFLPDILPAFLSELGKDATRFCSEISSLRASRHAKRESAPATIVDSLGLSHEQMAGFPAIRRIEKLVGQLRGAHSG